MSRKLGADTNSLNWFEIPAKDINRASKFYETILEIQTTPLEMMGMKMAMFPTDSAKGLVGGAVVQSEMHIPSSTGSIVYLNANPDLQKVLDRVEKAGGKVNMPKTLIDENTGHMAFITDSEGNTVGLHSTK